jgi:DivIVA domain-containing protein
MRHHDRFHRVGRLHKGYHRRQVDAFVNHVEVSLGGVFQPPTATEVRQAGFELVRGGYDVAQVDEYLDVLEDRVILAQSANAGRRGRPDLGSEAAYLRDELSAPYMRRFPRSRFFRRGYAVDDVDDFVDAVVATLQGSAVEGEVTVEDVRRAPFTARRGGYREEAVDDAMDRVVEHLLQIRREARPPAVVPPEHLGGTAVGGSELGQPEPTA